MKRIICSLLLVASLSLSWAGTIVPKPIVIRPRPTVPRPAPVPVAEDLILFSAYAEEDAITIISEAITGTIQISITGPTGIVYSSFEDVVIGSEVIVPVSSLPAGAYTLYIMCGDDIYVGEFEVE